LELYGQTKKLERTVNCPFRTGKYSFADALHIFSHSGLLGRQNISPIVRLCETVSAFKLRRKRFDAAERSQIVTRTRSWKGPPDHRDSMLSCTISWLVPPGNIAMQIQHWLFTLSQYHCDIPPRYPFPMGSHSLAHIFPGAVYQRPLPELGKPGGAERVSYVTTLRVLSKRFTNSRMEHGRTPRRGGKTWRKEVHGQM
jgi:hypothetical protein